VERDPRDTELAEVVEDVATDVEIGPGGRVVCARGICQNAATSSRVGAAWIMS